MPNKLQKGIFEHLGLTSSILKAI